MEATVFCEADAALMITGPVQLLRLADGRKAFASSIEDAARVLPAVFSPGERTCVRIRYGMQ